MRAARRLLPTLGIWTLVSLIAQAAGEASAVSSLAFRQPTIAGDEFVLEVTGAKQLTVVCFLGTECPLAKLYGPRLQTLADQFAAQRVRFVGVFSNQQDAVEEIGRYAEQLELRFPMIKDDQNRLADQFGATRTPQVFAIDEQLNVCYRGRIDDQYLPGISRPRPAREELREALAQWVAGKPVAVAMTEPAGCLIGRVKEAAENADVTFCNQVVRILQRQCVECHRPGEIGPFALTDYDEVVGWADMILEVIHDGRMPPWHANPDHGQFKNERRMSLEEKATLARWVESGAPYGDEKDLPTEQPSYVHGWQLPRDPEQVIAMSDRPFQVPAEGTVEYQYFVVDPQFTEDRWVTAAQVVPGNPAVVHHSIVFVRPPDGHRFRGVGWLTAYVPGQRSDALPPGRARHVPAGSKLVFQQHYTPNGKVQADLTRLGLVFGDPDEITHEMVTLMGIEREFEIPPYDPQMTVEARVGDLPDQGELLSIMPHMHLRGKSFRCWLEIDDEQQILLDVPRYDFNWQHVYYLKESLPVAQIKALKFAATFDNSAANPFNPDPSARVTWGDQTWEEMAVAFYDIAVPRHAAREEERARTDEQSTSDEARVERIVEDFFARFDANSDGVVERSETPTAFSHFAFWRFDRDEDRRLTRPEIREAARERVR